MLLNPSHKITFSGLPPDVLDAYVRYKKGSRALVGWLIQYSPLPNRRVKTLPIKELEALAKIAATSLRSIPDVVHFYFRETITARKRLSKYFRAQIDESVEDLHTINHEHFTTRWDKANQLAISGLISLASLAQIYKDLCACCGRSDHQPGHKKSSSTPTPVPESPINSYVGLDVEHVSDDQDEAEESALSSCPECTAVTATNCDGKRMEVHFADDELGTFLEVNAAVQRIQDIISSTEQCWQLAAKGQLSFTVAAFISNVAFSMLRQVGVELLEHDEQLNLSGLHQMCCSRSGTTEAKNGESSSHVLLDDLQKLEQSLLHYREGHDQLIIPSCAGCIQKPAEYIQTPANDSGAARPQFTEAIVDNIVHLVATTVAPPSIIRNSTPVYADVGYLITRTDEKTQPWPAVLGLDLLTKGYKSYLTSLESANEISKCRLAALRLAQQASAQVARILDDKTCFACRCTQTLAYHLQNLGVDLQAYARYKCWDIYFQSPWVAGSQLLEILDSCHYYGMRLFNYRHYVGAVLHSYNALRQLGGLEEIPILESLCEQFGGIFFPAGSRPKGSFRACWSRYVGARLKFKKGHRNRNSGDAWCMAIPAHAARRAAGLGVAQSEQDLSMSKIDCLLFRVKQQDYHVSDDVWDSVNNLVSGAKASASKPPPPRKEKAGRSSSTTSSRESLVRARAQAPERRLLDLAEAAQKSFDATSSSSSVADSDADAEADAEAYADTNTNSNTVLPAARLNMFAVFEKCVRVVSTLSDGTHTGPDEQGTNCICFASAILMGGDRIVDGRKLGRLETWKKDEKECVHQAKKAIKEVFAVDVDTKEQWLWSV